METILLVIALGVINLFCFITGAKVGQMVVRHEKIETPEFNPIKAVNKAITEHKEKEEAKAEKEKLETILRNIERYDGTGSHQEDVPMN